MVATAIELYCLLVVVDVLLGWVQEDAHRWPRRWTHRATEPILIGLRKLNPALGWDFSPLMLIAILSGVKWGCL